MNDVSISDEQRRQIYNELGIVTSCEIDYNKALKEAEEFQNFRNIESEIYKYILNLIEQRYSINNYRDLVKAWDECKNNIVIK